MKLRFKLPKWAGILGAITTTVATVGSLLPQAQHGVGLLQQYGVHVPPTLAGNIAIAGVVVTLLSDALGHKPAQQTTTVTDKTDPTTTLTKSTTKEVDADSTTGGTTSDNST